MFTLHKKTVLSIFALVTLVSGSLSFAGGDFFDAIKKGDLEEVKRLVEEKKVDVNKGKPSTFVIRIRFVKDGTEKLVTNSENPLHYACKNSNLEIVKYLIEKGAQESINKKVKGFPNPTTPLYWACYWKNLEMVKCLVENGAQIDHYSLILFNFSYFDNLLKAKVKPYVLNAKNFDKQKTGEDKASFVINKIKSVFANKLSPRLRPTGASTDATPFILESKIRSIQAKRSKKYSQEIIDLVRLAFCRSIFEIIDKQELYTKTVFYKLYQNKKDKKIRGVILQAFGIYKSDLDEKYPKLVKIILDKIDLGVAKSRDFKSKMQKFIEKYKLSFSRMLNNKKYRDCIIKTYL
ncbi:ankyrin repeat domain-containing protein [Candidatus Dependentiae bacterium]